MNRGVIAVAAALFVAGAPWVLSSPAAAQATSAARVDAEARSLFEAGRAAFGDGRFEDALGYFRRSYELSHRPELLYNIGQSQDRLRHDVEAVAAFEEFLAVLPHAPQREEITARLAILRASIARAELDRAAQGIAPVEATEAAEAIPVEATEIVVAPIVEAAPDPAPWIVLGAGGVVAVVGAILLGVGYADVATVENARDVPFSSVSRAYHDAPVLTGTGWTALGVGVAVAGVGLGWGLASGGGSSEQAQVRIGPTGVAVSGSF